MRRALPILAVAFCAGAVLRLTWFVPAWLLAVGMALAGAALWNSRLASAAAIALLVLAGALRASAWLQRPPDSAALLASRKWVRLHGFVDADPAVRPWGSVLTLHTEWAETRRGSTKATGRVRIYPPEGVGPFRYGTRLAAEGRISLPDDAANPGEVPPAQWLKREGIVATMAPRDVRVEPGRGGSRLMGAALQAKATLERGIRATLPAPDAALLTGLLFSDTGALAEDTQRDFARAGTVHILSTSGLHVAILAGLLALVWPARQPAAKKRRAVALLFALAAFSMMTGMRPAVARASFMTAVLLAAPLFDREPDVWCSLALAAAALVAWSPGNLLDPGFQLSFAAAVALALWFSVRSAPAPEPRWRIWLRRARTLVATSVVASLATAPLSARYFGTFSLAAPLSNVMVVPVVGPAMGLGLAQGLAWKPFPAAAHLAAAANRPLLDWMLTATHQVSGCPSAAWEAGSALNVAILLFYTAFGACLALRMRRATRLSYLAAIPAAAAMAIIAWPPRPALRVTFLDVGQGDSALIQTAGGRNVLIDAGGSPQRPDTVGRRVVVPALRRAGVRRLDVILLSHPHDDHLGGLAAVMAAVPTTMWMAGPRPTHSPAMVEALQTAAARGVSLRMARAGDRLTLEPGVTLDVLAPVIVLRGTPDDANNNSVVYRLTAPGASVLFAGDMEQPEEDSLLASGREVRAEVLKVGHHGAHTSTSPAFLAAVRPRIAIISAGRHNSHGHPSPATLARLAGCGAEVRRTDLHGGITVEWSNGSMSVKDSRWLWSE